MANVNIPKLLALVERLKNPGPASFTDLDFTNIINTIQKHLNMRLTQLNQSRLFQTLRYPTLTKSSPNSLICSSYLIYLLRLIVDNCNVDDVRNVANLLTPRQQQTILNWIACTATLQIGANLRADFLKTSHLLTDIKPNETLTPELRRDFMAGAVRAYAGFFQHRWVALYESIDLTMIQYMSAMCELLYVYPDASDDNHQQFVRFLDELFRASNVKYMKTLFVIKLNVSLKPQQHERLHRDLLRRVQSPRGFECLTRNLLPSDSEAPEYEQLLSERSETVASICARRGHTLAFYANIRAQCEKFITTCLHSKKERIYMRAGLETINKMYELPDGGGQCAAIEAFIFAGLRKFAEPGDVLAGRVVLDHTELNCTLELVRIAFNGQLSYKLPSRLLVNWLPLLMQLHAKSLGTTDHTNRLIVYCLANSSKDQLGELINILLYENYPDTFFTMHDRLEIHQHPTTKQITCRVAIGTEGNMFCGTYSAPQTLNQVLKLSEHNILIYNVFLHLLEQLAEVDEPAEAPASLDDREHPLNKALLQPGDFAAIDHFIKDMFDKRFSIVSTLAELIEYKPFHAQFNENPTESLDCMKNLLKKRVQKLRAWRAANDPRQDEREDQTNLLILAVIREFIEGLVFRARYQGFCSILQEYRAISVNGDVLNHIDGIMRLLTDHPFMPQEERTSRVESARILCSSDAPHLKVYGLNNMNRLVSNVDDDEVLAKRHTVLMLAMDGLKHEDSYVFLACIRLLVSLVPLLESEVIETMVAEYQMKDANIDYRLKVGEVIVKVTVELGALSYKYKDILIRCFLDGCTNENDDLRTSSLSCMATLLHLLSYQVPSFFLELIDMTQHIVMHDQHVPCRRAAVMMLSHLIYGFQELQQYQDMLLPVYRAFKYVCAHETDTTTIVHAQIGLKQLQQKVTQFLTTEPPAKEIQIFGINEPKDAKHKKNILEIL